MCVYFEFERAANGVRLTHLPIWLDHKQFSTIEFKKEERKTTIYLFIFSTVDTEYTVHTPLARAFDSL